MKKILNILAVLAAACLTVFSFSGCKFLFALGAAAAESEKNKTDSDHIDLTDDGSVQKITSVFQKLEKFHGDLSNFSSSKTLYTIQVNRAPGIKYETGYIYPNSTQSNRSVENTSELPSVVTDTNVRVNTTPEFINEFNRNKEKYLNLDKINGARAAGPTYGGGSSEKDPLSYELGSERTFYVARSMNETNKGDKKTGVLRYKNDNCLLYVAEEDIKAITDKDTVTYSSTKTFDFEDTYLKTFADTFSDYYKKVTNVMGNDDLTVPVTYNKLYKLKTISTSAAGDDSKVVLFINDIFNDTHGTEKGSVLGYFWECDLYNGENYNTEGKTNLYTNECKILYLDSYNLQLDYLRNQKIVISTVMHEFTHMLNFIHKGSGYETWFTEMLAMTAEDIMANDLGFTPGDPSSVFMSRLPYFNLLYGNGFSSKVWSGEEYASAYSNTYAFGSYLLRNYGGVKLINKIATNEYVNEEAITKALQASGYSRETFESVLSKFGQILINFDYIAGNRSSSDSYFTLNREIKNDSLNSIYYQIKPLDLSEYGYEFSDGTKYIGPQLKENTKRYSIGGWGIEVKEMGTVSQYKTFDAQLPTNESCDLYVYIN